MKKKFMILMMIFVLVFSFSPASLAATGDGDENVMQPYSTAGITYAIDRISASKADVYVNVVFTTTVDSYNVVVYLQKLVDGEWEIDIDNDEYVFYNNGFNRRIFTFFNTYEGLERGASYRIMCISKDHVGDTVSRTTSYSNPF